MRYSRRALDVSKLSPSVLSASHNTRVHVLADIIGASAIHLGRVWQCLTAAVEFFEILRCKGAERLNNMMVGGYLDAISFKVA